MLEQRYRAKMQFKIRRVAVPAHDWIFGRKPFPPGTYEIPGLDGPWIRRDA